MIGLPSFIIEEEVEEDTIFLAWDTLFLPHLLYSLGLSFPSQILQEIFLSHTALFVSCGHQQPLMLKKKKKSPPILLQSLFVLGMWDPLNSPIIVYTPRDKEPCGFPFVEQYKAEHTDQVLCNRAADCRSAGVTSQ